MKQLFRKEFNEIVCSPTGWFYAFVFAVVPGLFLWLFQGDFNIPDTGYAEVGSLFELLSILLLVMIPAISMRTYADEKKLKTWELLLSRPLRQETIFSGKFFAVWLFSIICMLPTLVTVVSVWNLGFPKGNLDLGQVGLSYFSVVMLSAIYSSVGLFASSQTKNAVAAFLLAVFIDFSLFYGFNLLSGLFFSGASQVQISDIGISNHFEETNKGVLHLNSMLVFVIYLVVFTFLTIVFSKQERMQLQKRSVVFLVFIGLLLIGNMFLPNISKDFTSDHRYTLSAYSRKVLDDLKSGKTKFTVNVYLEGQLNSGFVRLRKQIDYLLDDANRQSNYAFTVNHVDPLQYGLSDKAVQAMEQKGMKGTMLNETDRNGKVSRQLLFPYIEIVQGQDTLHVNVLKNIPGNTAEENLKASAENMEYEFIDALRMLTDRDSRNIAFIEGHNELPRPYLYDAEEALAKYYSVNRGEISDDPKILSPFKVVIIAGPTGKYTERQKYILDQYIMHGGRVLWLLDGIYFSEEQLAAQGKSVTVVNSDGVDDMLFTYGVRVNPVLLQDEQSASLLVNSGKEDNTQSTVIPWYFCPLLIPSPNNPVTKDIALVKAPYAGSLDLIKQPSVTQQVLLTTSDKTHVVKATEEVNFEVENIPTNRTYFNQQFLIASASLEGQFTSAFVNRMIPDSVQNGEAGRLNQSLHSKMIVVASSSVIRNELAGQGNYTQVVPLGFDRTTGKQFGNKDFIVNAVNWLANDDDLMLLRQKQQQLRLLNKAQIYKNRNSYVALNLIVPFLLLGGFVFAYNERRRRKYGK